MGLLWRLTEVWCKALIMGPDCSRCSVNIISYYYYYHYYCQASRISPYLHLLISVIKGAVRNRASLALKGATSLILRPIGPTWCELEGHHILMRIALSFCPSDCSHASLRAQAWPPLHKVPWSQLALFVLRERCSPRVPLRPRVTHPPGTEGQTGGVVCSQGL